MNSLHDIELACEDYRDARDSLADDIAETESRIADVKRQQLPAIRDSLRQAQTLQEQLRNLIETGKDLFNKPKSRVWHGVKVGYRKLKGKTVCDDPARTITLIRKHFPDKAEQLIKTTEKPNLTALGEMTAADLKRLGVQIQSDTDDLILKPVDSEIDKIVDALLEGIEDDHDQEAA